MGIDTSFEKCAPITPHDTNNITNGPCKGFIAFSDDEDNGDLIKVSVVCATGRVCDLKGKPGEVYPIKFYKVRSTYTNADTVYGLW